MGSQRGGLKYEPLLGAERTGPGQGLYQMSIKRADPYRRAFIDGPSGEDPLDDQGADQKLIRIRSPSRPSAASIIELIRTQGQM